MNGRVFTLLAIGLAILFLGLYSQSPLITVIGWLLAYVAGVERGAGH